jgi:hypothetical protein
MLIFPSRDGAGCSAPLAQRTPGCDHLVMQDCDPAQAAELIRALRDHLREMTGRLGRVDGREVPGTNGDATRLEAAALRRDIAEAQMHIDRLYRRYLNGDERPSQQRPAGGHPRAANVAFRWTSSGV